MALLLLPLYFVGAPLAAHFTLAHKRSLVAKRADLSTEVQAALSHEGALTLATERDRQYMARRVDSTLRQMVDQTVRVAIGSQAQAAGNSFLSILGPVLLYGMATTFTETTPGTLVAFSAYLTQLSVPARRLSDLYVGFRHATFQWERLDE